MRAIQVQEFGGPEVLVPVTVPDPAIGPGQVLVDVVAADVIYLDTLLRQGWGGDFFPLQLPYVPGGGGAGRVVAIGEGVDEGLIGRTVVAPAIGGYTGGYAGRFVADAGSAVEVPETVSALQAAALLHDGATALDLARLGEVEKGQRVLVSAAAGGAGSLLVQLLRDAGAEVVAAARGERKLALARELGAAHAVDYSEEGWAQRVLDATGGVDVIFDGAGGELAAAAFEAVVDGGRFVTYGTANGGFAAIAAELAERRRVRVVNALDRGEDTGPSARMMLEEALALVSGGRLRPTIGTTYPLEQARDAHQALADRVTVGKSLLLG